MQTTLAMILAGGKSSPQDILSRKRAKSAIPFGGKYRIIDFVLSNCVNSGIYDIGILAQYAPKSLAEHIKAGKPWDLDRQVGGVRILQPYLGRTEETGWYRGTADALYQNLDFITQKNPNFILVLSGDHIYKMDYRKMLEFHQQKNAPVTIAITEVSESDAKRLGIVQVDSRDRVVHFEEKPQYTKSNLASMGIYLFNTDMLLEKLNDIGKNERYDIVFHILIELIQQRLVYAYRFSGYWKDIGANADYWQANMDLLDASDRTVLYNPSWIIHTTSERKPPVRFHSNATVLNSLVANGCVIDGYVEHSILFPGVHVARHARVTNSVVMHRTMINENATIDYAILDKDIWIGADSVIGGNDIQPQPYDRQQLEQYITVIGKGVQIPSRMHIGRGCLLDPDIPSDFFTNLVIPNHSYIKYQK
ncbi:MAG: glucose-1-phosphate adenylyltransferase subunit GlgD [bacterium]|nr:glucose-1-phosphate adenylyltransferase subunit GlgD [bacterium]